MDTLREDGNRATAGGVRPLIISALVSVLLLWASHASADTTVDCRRNPKALDAAIAAASSGDRLRIEGTCLGIYTLDKNVTLSGNRDAAIDGDGHGPVLSIVAGVQVVVQDLIVTGGSSVAPAAVGGILNRGTLHVVRSKVVRNRAVGDVRATGGIESGPVSTASLSLDRSEVFDNTASAVSGGPTTSVAGIRNDGPVTMSRVEVHNNTAFVSSPAFNRAYGGILFGPGPARVDRSVIRDNTARSEHTGVTGSGLVGGAIGGFAHLLGTDELVVDSSVVQGNRAFAVSAVGSGAAGAMATGGTLAQLTTMIRTDLVGNSAEATTFAAGGIANNSTTVALERSTIDGNAASTTAAGGVTAGGIATGFFGAAHTALMRSSVTGNTAAGADVAGGLYQVAGRGSHELQRTEIAGNVPNDCNFACQP